MPLVSFFSATFRGGAASSVLPHSDAALIKIMFIGTTVVFLGALTLVHPISAIGLVFLLVVRREGNQA